MVEEEKRRLDTMIADIIGQHHLESLFTDLERVTVYVSPTQKCKLAGHLRRGLRL